MPGTMPGRMPERCPLLWPGPLYCCIECSQHWFAVASKKKKWFWHGEFHFPEFVSGPLSCSPFCMAATWKQMSAQNTCCSHEGSITVSVVAHYLHFKFKLLADSRQTKSSCSRVCLDFSNLCNRTVHAANILGSWIPVWAAAFWMPLWLMPT